jgi:soluble lytic murein transglycosylase-like protein
MSIQPDNKVLLYSPVAPVSPARVVGDLKRSPGKNDAGAFSRILGDMVTGSSALPQAPPGNEPLGKEKVLQLVQWMNIKMNESLLRSVEGEGFDASYRWKFDSLLPPPVKESAVVEETVKPDINQELPGVIPVSSGRGYEEIIQKAAATYDVDPALIRGVIQVESNFNASAQSPKGAMGLMQLMPETARELGVSDPYDPEANIMGGTRYLKRLLNRYDGDVSLALAAYNWGMGNLENHRNWMPQETKNYVNRITSMYNRSDQSVS